MPCFQPPQACLGAAHSLQSRWPPHKAQHSPAHGTLRVSTRASTVEYTLQASRRSAPGTVSVSVAEAMHAILLYRSTKKISNLKKCIWHLVQLSEAMEAYTWPKA